MLRLLRVAVPALLGLLALTAGPAAAHHPYDAEAETRAALGGQHRSVFSAMLAEAPPLTGAGENMALVANVPLSPDARVPGGANDTDFANNGSDIEMAGDYAYLGSYTQGMVIINIASCDDISNPGKCKPFVQGVYKCSGGQFDVQLSPDATVAVVAHESASADKDCHPGEEGVAIIDIRDKSNPREVAFISDKSGQVIDGAHNVTLDWPNLYVDQYTQTYGKAEVYSLAPQSAAPNASPSRPTKLGEVTFPPQNGQSGFHDSFPSHRPDRKNLLYGASIQKSDIVNIDDPRKPVVAQTIVDPQVGISHGAEPNHDRSLLIVTDEYGGGTGVGACGGGPNPDPAIPLPGQTDQIASVGAVHFYRLDKNTGLVGAGGTDKAGIFNIPAQANEPAQVAAEAGCTSHVFWQAPAENRMTIAWYGRGTRVVDYSNPAQAKQLGWYVPTGGDTWAAKPHRGFIFTGDIVRGMDVLRYTKGGWPTTSGPAELQRGFVQRGGPSTGKPGARSDLVISRATRRLRRGRIGLRVRCRSAVPCTGKLRLFVRVKRRGAARTKGRYRHVTIARRNLTVKGGKRAVLRVRVNRNGRRYVGRRKRVRTYAHARLRPPVGVSNTKPLSKGSFRLLAPRRAKRR